MIDVVAAERTVLGSMLKGPKGVAAGRNLTAADFGMTAHQTLHTFMLRLDAAGKSVDVLTLFHELQQAHIADSVGGFVYIDGLTDGIPAHGNPEGWVRILRKESQRRHLLMALQNVQTKLEDGDEPEDVMAEAMTTLRGTQVELSTAQPVHISQWVGSALRQLEDERNHQGDVLGIPTGIPHFDTVTTGWRPGELSYVGAIPGRGKTTFLTQCALSAERAGYGVGVISLEMRGEQLVRRLLVQSSNLSSFKVRDPRNMDPAEYSAAGKTLVNEIGNFRMWGLDVSGLRPAQITNAARQMHQNGAQIIFVDFVQIIREDGKDRREAINRVSAALRDTAKELNIPFVVASQLARRDADENRKPTMQDLRESGNLEQDAHRVVLIYRPKDKSGAWTGEDELIIAKAREGVDGHVDVTFDDVSLMFRPRSYASEVRR